MRTGLFLPAEPAAKGQICVVADGGLVRIDSFQAQKKTSVDVFLCLFGGPGGFESQTSISRPNQGFSALCKKP